MNLLQGKVVAITGAGGGLGRAYALFLAREGARVVVNDLGVNREGAGGESSMADAVVAEIKAAGGEAVANYASVATMEGAASIVDSAVQTFGRLDVLVNNAGIVRDKTLLKMTEEMWDTVIAVHLKGTFCCSFAAATRMKEQESGGSIINTTSFAGLKGNFGQTNYAAAKAGIYGMTLVNALELRKIGVRVNAIAPMAKTRMTSDLAMVSDRLTPDLIAPMAAFLASDLSTDISGRIFGVHGGHLFEYKMTTTEGVEADAWTPSSILEKLPEIAGEVAGTEALKPGAPAPKSAAPASSSAAIAPATPAVTEPQTPQERIAATFEFMPAGFVPGKAEGWNAVLHWEITGTGDFTIAIADGKCTSDKGKVGTPTCVIKTDTDTFIGITDNTVDGTQAYMQGKISATNVGDLMKYQKAIDGAKARAAFEASLQQAAAAIPPSTAAAPARSPAVVAQPAPPASPAEPAGPSKGERILEAMGPDQRLRMLLGMFPALAEEVAWTPPVCLNLTAGDLRCTVEGGDKGLSVVASHAETPTSRVVGSAEGVWKVFTDPSAGDLVASAEVMTSSMSELRRLIAALGEDPAGCLAAELEERGEGINPDAVGTWFHGDPAFVKLGEILDFAEATSDPNPWFVVDAREGGTVAPPLFAVRYFNVIYGQVLTDPHLKVDISRLLFGEMEMQFNRPVRAGDLVATKAWIMDLESKDTGQVMRVASRLMLEGEVAVDSVATFFVRWPRTRIKPLKRKGGQVPAAPELAFEYAAKYRDDQTRLFAAASNDPNPIHVDDDIAKAAGLPGRIIHGLCTMAFCSRAFVQEVCEGDPNRLERLKVRFSKPARPGQTLTTRAFAPVEKDGGRVYTFEAVNEGGDKIITGGVARVRGA